MKVLNLGEGYMILCHEVYEVDGAGLFAALWKVHCCVGIAIGRLRHHVRVLVIGTLLVRRVV